MFRFETNDLFSKYGFGDGDMFLDLLYKLEREKKIPNGKDFGLLHVVSDGDLLLNIITKYVLPQITSHKVEIYFIKDYHHNPVRARTVDNQTEPEDGWDIELSPLYVNVEEDVILKEILDMIDNKYLVKPDVDVEKRIEGIYGWQKITKYV